nr:tetraspanin-10 isoform X1 [Tanacetum cinerariifolium]
ALIHQTEVSWDVPLNPTTTFKIGQVVEAKVHQLDFSLERIYLSLKEITPDPLTESLEAVIDDHSVSDSTLEAERPEVEWADLELLVNELRNYEGIELVTKGRFFLSPGLTPTFQVYMASMFKNQYKLLAQEVVVQTWLSTEEMKHAILSRIALQPPFASTQEQMSSGTSTFVIRWVNFLTMLVALVVMGYGVWMSTHHDSCQKSLTLPIIGLGSLIFIISVLGFVGALKQNCLLLWTYLIMLCLVLVGILVFTVFVFIVTNDGSGHSVAGLRYKEYQLQDYGSWFVTKLNNTHNWKHIRSCFVKAETCHSLPKRYKTLKQYKLAKLTPIEAGCCRPPSQCGYPAVNASHYDLSFHPISSNKDCKRYKNSKAIKCYNCDSCKAGVAQYIK